MIEIPRAARAEYYRVYKRIRGVDAEPVAVGSPTDPDFTLERLPRNAEIELSVSAVNSLMAVVAPVLGAPLLGVVSDLPRGDWRIGAPFYFCAAVQAVALGLAWMHFGKARRARLAAARPT